MQKGKTSKFVPKLGLVLWMLPLSSWAISGTIPEANSALTSYAHEAREIDAIAQSAKKRTVTGTITDASDGTPIIGANIVVKGSQTGVISGLDGNYSIEVTGGNQQYSSPIYHAEKSFSHFRFAVLESAAGSMTNGNAWFNLGELVLYGN